MADPYRLRISPLTVDKLGVKLYDKASAVVAELVANGYDADAEHLEVHLPLGTALARKVTPTELQERKAALQKSKPRGGEDEALDEPAPEAPAIDEVVDHGYVIKVTDDGHGMTPEEARRFYLDVGRDRRRHPDQGGFSRKKQRPVMGRKGIGKLAPFGICRRIEVLSAGGDNADGQGYVVSHFFLDYDRIVADVPVEERNRDGDGVELETGEHDGERRSASGTTIRLSQFWPRNVPVPDVFMRQLMRRFVLARDDFDVVVHDTRADVTLPVDRFNVPIMSETRLDLAEYPVRVDGQELPVTGWLALAEEAYKNEETAGVRVYARGKIVATTRDFEQPAGYTGEFTTRSYLVGEVTAEWLDRDDGDDLVRTDRQDILWDSELGEALREWGATLIRKIGAAGREPRRKRVRASFMQRSALETRARERFQDEAVVQAAVELGQQIGAFAAEDELEDEVYVDQLREVILTVAPHRALIGAFQEFQQLTLGIDESLDSLAGLFGKTRVAEMASYSQIAHERVQAIQELEALVLASDSVEERRLQRILTNAPYLIEPTWTVITQNQALKTFKRTFEAEYLRKTGETITLAIEWEDKRPDFVLTNIGGLLHVVEIKKPKHQFDDDDFDRMHRYVEAFTQFAADHPEVLAEFSRGWRIDLVADGVNIRNGIARTAYESLERDGRVRRVSWFDFLGRARKAHEQFLDASDRVRENEPAAPADTADSSSATEPAP